MEREEGKEQLKKDPKMQDQLYDLVREDKDGKESLRLLENLMDKEKMMN